MAMDKEFETPFHPDKRFFLVPRSFYRRWRNQLPHLVELRDNRGLGLLCAIEPQPGDKAHFYTNIKAITEAYGLTEPVIMKIEMLAENSFRFSFPNINYHEVQNPHPRQQGRNHMLGNRGSGSRTPSTIFSSFVPARQRFGPEPFWEAVMTDSKASGRQALHVPAKVVHSTFKGRPTHVQVLLPNQKVVTWKLIWNQGISSMCHIDHGWYKFA